MSAILARSTISTVVTTRRSQQQQRRSVAVAAWQPAISVSELESKGNKAVVEIGGDKVLVAKAGDGEVYAVSNKCPHLGLPLVGKTALLQGEVSAVGGKQCVTCPAHGTVFALSDGKVQGEWCPKLPNLPIIGKGPKEAPLKTFSSRVSESGTVEVDK